MQHCYDCRLEGLDSLSSEYPTRKANVCTVLSERKDLLFGRW